MAILRAPLLAAAVITDSLGREWDGRKHPRGRDGKFIHVFKMIRAFFNDGDTEPWMTGQVTQLNDDGSVRVQITKTVDPNLVDPLSGMPYVGHQVDIHPNFIESVNEKAMLKKTDAFGKVVPPGASDAYHEYDFSFDNLETFWSNAGLIPTDLGPATKSAADFKDGKIKAIPMRYRWELALYAKSISGDNREFSDAQYMEFLGEIGVDPDIIDDTPDGMSGLASLADLVNTEKSPDKNILDSQEWLVERPNIHQGTVREAHLYGQDPAHANILAWFDDGSQGIIFPDGHVEKLQPEEHGVLKLHELESPNADNPPEPPEPEDLVTPDPVDSLNQVLEENPFQILDDPGTSGDGYYATTDGSKLWGKYGAAGVMVRHVDEDGTERFLMVQRGPIVSSNKGKWQLPGGALNSNENDYQGTARELAEELDPPDGFLESLNAVGDVNFEHPSGWHYNNIAADAPEQFEPHVDGTETGDAGWFTREEIAQLPLHPALEKNLDQIFSKFDVSNQEEANAPEPPPEPEDLVPNNDIIDATDWMKVGGQGGSNPGGFFEDPDGNRWYVKKGKSDDHAKNEAIAAALYEEAGIDTAELHVAETPFGGLGTASPVIPGAKQDLKNRLADPDYKKKIQEGYAVDAWLANWDVAGLVYDNIMTDGKGNPVRVDPGGALLYRAQGAPKGGAFGPKVGEFETFHDPGNTGSKLFDTMTWDDKKVSAQKVIDISPEKIDEIVDGFEMSPDASQKLKDTLKSRREYIADYFDIPLPEKQSNNEPVAELPGESPTPNVEPSSVTKDTFNPDAEYELEFSLADIENKYGHGLEEWAQEHNLFIEDQDGNYLYVRGKGSDLQQAVANVYSHSSADSDAEFYGDLEPTGVVFPKQTELPEWEKALLEGDKTDTPPAGDEPLAPWEAELLYGDDWEKMTDDKGPFRFDSKNNQIRIGDTVTGADGKEFTVHKFESNNKGVVVKDAAGKKYARHRQKLTLQKTEPTAPPPVPEQDTTPTAESDKPTPSSISTSLEQNGVLNANLTAIYTTWKNGEINDGDELDFGDGYKLTYYEGDNALTLHNSETGEILTDYTSNAASTNTWVDFNLPFIKMHIENHKNGVHPNSGPEEEDDPGLDVGEEITSIDGTNKEQLASSIDTMFFLQEHGTLKDGNHISLGNDYQLAYSTDEEAYLLEKHGGLVQIWYTDSTNSQEVIDGVHAHLLSTSNTTSTSVPPPPGVSENELPGEYPELPAGYTVRGVWNASSNPVYVAANDNNEAVYLYADGSLHETTSHIGDILNPIDMGPDKWMAIDFGSSDSEANDSFIMPDGYPELQPGDKVIAKYKLSPVYLVKQGQDGKLKYFYQDGTKASALEDENNLNPTHWDPINRTPDASTSTSEPAFDSAAELANINDIPKTLPGVMKLFPGAGLTPAEVKNYRNAGYALDDASKEEVGSQSWLKAVNKAAYNLEHAGPSGAPKLQQVLDWKTKSIQAKSQAPENLSPDTSSSPTFTLPNNFAPLHDDVVKVYKSKHANVGTYAGVHADGAVTYYYNDGSIGYKNFKEENMSPDSWEHVWTKSGDTSGGTPSSGILPSNQGFVQPPTGSEAFAKYTDDVDDTVIYAVKQPNEDKIYYYWSDGKVQKMNVTKDQLVQAMGSTHQWSSLGDNNTPAATPTTTSSAVNATPQLPFNQIDAKGKQLKVGDTVHWTTKNQTATVKGFEKNGKPGVFIDTGDGKKKAIHHKKLVNQDDNAASVVPQTGNGGVTPTSGGPIPATPGLAPSTPKLEPILDHPMYGKPKPEAPEMGEEPNKGVPYLDNSFIEQVNAHYQKRMAANNSNWSPKHINQSSTYTELLSIVESGNLSALEAWHSKGRLSDALYDQAKQTIVARNITKDAFVKEHSEKLEKYHQELKEWRTANGFPNISLKGMDGAKTWSNGAVATSWMNNHMYAGKYGPNGHLSQEALSAVSSQKGSTIALSLRHSLREKSKDPAEIDKLPLGQQLDVKNMDLAMQQSPALPEDIIVTRMMVTDAFLDPITKKPLTHKGQISSIAGTIQHDWGFAETVPGESPTYGSSRPAQMRIRVPKGTKGVWTLTPGLGLGLHSEHGFILDRGIAYYIHKVEYKNGKYYIDAEIIPKDEVNYDEWGNFINQNPFFD